MAASNVAIAAGTLALPWMLVQHRRELRAQRRRLVEERRAQARWLAAHGYEGAVPAERILSPGDPVLEDPAANAAWDARERRAALRLLTSR